MKLRFLYSLIIYLMFSYTSFAQQYFFRSYGVEEGMPQSEVFDVIEDHQGVMWFATNGGGLVRFSGLKLETFTTEDGLLSNTTGNLFQDSKKRIWISTPQGVNIYDGNSFTKLQSSDSSINNSQLTSFTETTNGEIIIYSAKRKLVILKGNKTTEIHLENIEPKEITGVKNFNKEIFIFTVKGTFIYNNGTVSNYEFDNSEITNDFPLKIDSKNNKWVLIAERNRKWFKLIKETQNGDKTEIKLSPTILKNGQTPLGKIFTVSETKDGKIWATINGNLFLIDNDELILYDRSKGYLKGESITFKAINSSDGTLWICTLGSGFIRLGSERFTFYNNYNGLNSEIIRSINEDSKGNYWFGTATTGVAKLSPNGEIKNFLDPNKVSIGRIMDLYEESDDQYLVATDNGLIRLNGTTGKYSYAEKDYNLPKGIRYNQIIKHNNYLYFACVGQVFKSSLDNKKETVPIFDSLKLYFNNIFVDTNENLWISSAQGVFKITPNGLSKRYGLKNGLKSEVILQSTQDIKGRIWVVTYGGGISYLENEKWITLNKKDGLAANNNYSIIADKDKNIWIGSQSGIDKITFKENGDIERIVNYGTKEGFIGIENNGFANFKDSKNNLWFGTIRTAVKYNPSKDEAQTKKGKIKIKNISLDYQKTNWYNDSLSVFYDKIEKWVNLPINLELPYDKNTISISYECLEYKFPEKVKYSWKLEGGSNKWSPQTTKTEIDFTSLSSGTYTFYVKAINASGKWTGDEACSYTFTILPPWWKTWWFYLLIVLFFCFDVFLIYKWRLRAIKQQNEALEKLVKERTTEISKQNKKLEGQKKELTIQADQLKEYNDEILTQNEEIEQQSEEIAAQRDMLQENNELIKKINHDMKASINYAHHIQGAIFPTFESIQKSLPNSFILFKPKDVVSGDFYWSHDTGTEIIIAAVDCTGHGVPGAFMSLIGSKLLDLIVKTKKITKTSLILNELHKEVSTTLKQKESNNRDGMDMVICTIDKNTKDLYFSGAKNPIVFIKNNQVQTIKGDRFPIGGRLVQKKHSYTEHHIPYSEDTTFYIFSDGLQDRFGGPLNKKYMLKRMKNSFIKINNMNANDKKEWLENELNNWKGAQKQIDDILVIGFTL